MIGMLCPFRRWQHKIIHPRMLDWIKRGVPAKLRDSLFMYYHLQAGTYVIAQWVVPDRFFLDVRNLEHSLDNFTKEMAIAVLAQLRDSVSRPDIAKSLRQYARDQASKDQERNDMQVERRRRRQSTAVKVSLSGAQPGTTRGD